MGWLSTKPCLVPPHSGTILSSQADIFPPGGLAGRTASGLTIEIPNVAFLSAFESTNHESSALIDRVKLAPGWPFFATGTT